MKFRHIVLSFFYCLWKAIIFQPMSELDLQEWIHLHGWCRDPLCSFYETERGQTFRMREIK